MEMKIPFDILVDLKDSKSIKAPVVTQNDSVIFILEVMQGGFPFDLTNATTISLAHSRNVGPPVVTPGTAVANKATFIIGTNETAVEGYVTAKAQFYDAEGRVSTLSFTYIVSKDPTGDGFIGSEVEQTLIQTVLNDGPLRIQEATDAAIYANAQGDYALQVATDNETNYLDAVSSVALRDSTYPTPVHGDTVRVTDISTSFRYVVGTGWVKTDVYNPTAIDEVTSQLADTVNDMYSRGINVQHPPIPLIGAKGDNITDDTQAIKNIIATGAKDIIFPSATYKITDELLFLHGQNIICIGKVTFDGSGFIGTNGANVVKATNTGNAYTTLPTISAPIVKGARELTFSTVHGLIEGDIICLYDNTEFSWSSARASYKKSEFAKVAKVLSTTTVLLDNGTFDNYDQTIGVYKMNMGSFNIYGNLEVIQSKLGYFNGIKIERVKDFVGSNIVSIAKKGSNSAIVFNQCYNTDIKCVAIQEELSGTGTDYGLSISNCQHFTADGYFSASRHGVSHGGSDGIGSIITRDSKIKGTVKSNHLGDTEAFDNHGNSEFVSFEGTIFGGANLSGKNTKIRGVIHANKAGTCVLFSEVKGFSHDLSGVQCISHTNPPGRGVIDFGGGSTVDMDNMEGGTLNLSNIEMIAPLATIGINIRKRNIVNTPSTEGIDIRGSNLQTSQAVGSLAYRIQDVSATKNFEYLDAREVKSNSENRSVGNVNKIYLEKLKGRNAYTTTTSSSNVSVTVTFGKPYPSTYIPMISTNLEVGALGGNILGKVTAVSSTSFTFQVLTLAGANFAVAGTYNFSWTAE